MSTSGLSYTLICFYIIIIKSKIAIGKTFNSQLIYGQPHAESYLYSPGHIEIFAVTKNFPWNRSHYII